MMTTLNRIAASVMILLAMAGLAAAETIPLKDVTHIHGITVDPEDATRVYLATHHGLYHAGPDGRAQRVSNHRDDLMGFTPHPAEPGTFFASGHPARGGNLGFLVSTDRGVSWRQISPGLNGPVDFHQMDVSRSDPKVVYGVHGGIQRSADGGRTWEAIAPPPEGLIDLAVAPGQPNTLYAATKAGLLISRDAGRSWAPAMMLRRPASMVATAADGRLYAYIVGTGLVRQDGENWAILGPLASSGIVLHFAAVSDRHYAVLQDNDILVSIDGAKTWRPYGR